MSPSGAWCRAVSPSEAYPTEGDVDEVATAERRRPTDCVRAVGAIMDLDAQREMVRRLARGDDHFERVASNPPARAGNVAGDNRKTRGGAEGDVSLGAEARAKGVAPAGCGHRRGDVHVAWGVGDLSSRETSTLTFKGEHADVEGGWWIGQGGVRHGREW